MIKWIVNACPFAPGAVKPATMEVPSQVGLTMRRRRVTWKSSVLVLSFLSLVLLYSHSYPSLNYSGIPVLFQDWFFIKMSIYTYVTSMLGFFIKKYRRR
jgi:hypothetical protein